VKEEARPPSPEPTFATYQRVLPIQILSSRTNASDALKEWTDITIRLVGSHPLWGHYLCVYIYLSHLPESTDVDTRWNAARAFADYLDTHPEFYLGGNVLELGAGGGLPSLVCAKNGARRVSFTSISSRFRYMI
jgi:nicotinamide N-methyltransferase